MNETVPTDDDIAKLEKAVKSARVKVHVTQASLRGQYAFEPRTPTYVFLGLSIVPVAPTKEEAVEEESKLMALDIFRGELAQAVEELEFAKERRRVDEVVKAREEEISFGKDVDDCPVCLDPLHFGSFDRLCDGVMPCCGKRICSPCFKKCSGQFTACPLCRHTLPVTPEYALEKREQLAKAGSPYFQCLIGKEYLCGKRKGGICKPNDRKALEYITLAAEGGFSEAQATLGFFYGGSSVNRGIVKKSPKDALHWYELAASNGHVMAHLNVALELEDGGGQYGYRMMTFAAHHGTLAAQRALSNAYSYFTADVEGIPKSFQRAKYWMGKVVHSPDSDVMGQGCSDAYSRYASLLLALQAQNMNGVVDVAGHGQVPEALYWFRKARQLNSVVTEEDGKLMEMCETIGSARCHCCKISSQTYKATKKGDMQKCTRCKWARYCSRECQLRHWSMGHKNDCKTKY